MTDVYLNTASELAAIDAGVVLSGLIATLQTGSRKTPEQTLEVSVASGPVRGPSFRRIAVGVMYYHGDVVRDFEVKLSPNKLSFALITVEGLSYKRDFDEPFGARRSYNDGFTDRDVQQLDLSSYLATVMEELTNFS